MIKRFAHICLAAKDLPAVQRFYCEGLGCRKAFDFIRDGKVFGFYLEISPGSFIEVFQQDEIDVDAKSPIRHFCLEVDDIDMVSQQLTRNGYEATEKKLGSDQAWQIWTTDPTGVKIEFHQYTPHSSQITHDNCILS